MQKLCYPMEYINISQGSLGLFSHIGQYAVDMCGRDSGSDVVFAQGDGTVVAINDKSVTVRYEKVVGQSGTVYDYCDVRCYHETADKGISVGDILKRGCVYMHEGKKGNATGNHIHVTVTGCYDGKTVKLMPERMFTVMPEFNKFIRNKSSEPVRIF